MKLNKLTINYKKSQLCLFPKKQNFDKCIITIGNHELEQTKQVKYLGIVFDKSLTWWEHIQHLCSKHCKGCWALLKLRNYVDLATLKNFIITLYTHIYNIAYPLGDLHILALLLL